VALPRGRRGSPKAWRDRRAWPLAPISIAPRNLTFPPRCGRNKLYASRPRSQITLWATVPHCLSPAAGPWPCRCGSAHPGVTRRKPRRMRKVGPSGVALGWGSDGCRQSSRRSDALRPLADRPAHLRRRRAVRFHRARTPRKQGRPDGRPARKITRRCRRTCAPS
jgi:hypothetical protein